MEWVSLKPRSRLLVTGLPYVTKYTMLFSMHKRRRSITLMLNAVTLTTMPATQYFLPQKIYARRDHVNYRTTS